MEENMDTHQKVLHVDSSSGFYKLERFRIGDFFGPVDLGLFLAKRYNSLNIGTGLLAGSIFPGSNRLIFSGFSPCWGNFYISSMGGAGLIFDNLGINMLCLRNKAPVPSVLYLNRTHGEEIEVSITPIRIHKIWENGKGGFYALLDEVLKMFIDKYTTEPRILAIGPASEVSDFGAIGSAPIKNNEISFVDTWAGRGGFGSKMLQEHGIAAIIYGGTFIDEDFRDRKVADSWFENRFHKKLTAKDLEDTTKYRFDPHFETGGTFGVNYAKIGGKVMAFNYRSIYWSEDERKKLHKDFILEHYLKQFNEETIQTKNMKNCGEPCQAVCKKLNKEFKKDYEPYQTMGPLCGIFDQRAAEKLNHHADRLGFDGISVGAILSWLMECLSENFLKPEDISITKYPVFKPDGFNIVEDSMNNADLGIEILDAIIAKKGIMNFKEGARKFARNLAREKGKKVMDPFIYNANARKGWMVPNQYWTPGVLSPMSIMGKYYMYYGDDFIPPRELGKKNAERTIKELILDNTGFCRFHRNWAEDMVPDIMESLFQCKNDFLKSIDITASRINSRNASVYWEPERNIDYIYTFLKRKHEVDGDNSKELMDWIDLFSKDKNEAALNFWFEIRKRCR